VISALLATDRRQCRRSAVLVFDPVAAHIVDLVFPQLPAKRRIKSHIPTSTNMANIVVGVDSRISHLDVRDRFNEARRRNRMGVALFGRAVLAITQPI